MGRIVLFIFFIMVVWFGTFVLRVNSACNKDKRPPMCFKCAPVCGTDGFTYTDRCFLNAYNSQCFTNTTARDGSCIAVKSPPVNECYPASEACPKNAANPKISDPVCGSDGKSYGNACTFNYQRKLNPKLQFVKCGNC